MFCTFNSACFHSCFQSLFLLSLDAKLPVFPRVEPEYSSKFTKIVFGIVRRGRGGSPKPNAVFSYSFCCEFCFTFLNVVLFIYFRNIVFFSRFMISPFFTELKVKISTRFDIKILQSYCIVYNLKQYCQRELLVYWVKFFASSSQNLCYGLSYSWA